MFEVEKEIIAKDYNREGCITQVQHGILHFIARLLVFLGLWEWIKEILFDMKQEIRKSAIAARLSLDESYCKLASKSIVNYCWQMIKQLSLEPVALYYPINNEVDVTALAQLCWQQDMLTLLPNDAYFSYWKPGDQLVKNKYGIMQPKTNSIKIAPKLVIMPLVAFDESGARIGYGAGFYDRVLSDLVVVKIGVAYCSQMHKQLPQDRHDVKLDVIITEQGIINVI
jgi:5-formyltetrahydrofolate cyclo-ligase